MSTTNILASLDAESAVIGGLILDNDKFDEISTLLEAEDFYSVANRKIFEGITHLLKMNAPADILTLEQYFKDKKLGQELGGISYLAEIVKNTPSAANISAYAEIVARYSKQRHFLKLGQLYLKCSHQKTKRS